MRRKLHEARFIQHSSVLANLPDALQDHGYVPTSRPNPILPHLSHSSLSVLRSSAPNYARLISHTKFVMLTSSLAFSS
jgi:hypothetical protein